MKLLEEKRNNFVISNNSTAQKHAPSGACDNEIWHAEHASSEATGATPGIATEGEAAHREHT